MKSIFAGIIFFSLLPVAGLALANETKSWAVPDPWMADGKGRLRIVIPSNQARAQVEVFRSNGAFVRALLPSPLEKGDELWFWDGKDDEGVKMPAGTYLLRVRSWRQGVEQSRVFPVRMLRSAR
jgi:flagellar hook assembly protein FlgD